MAAEQDALRRNISEKRVEIDRDLDMLEDRLRDRYEEARERYDAARDWRRIVRSHPFTSAAAVLGVGLLVGLRLGGGD